MTICHIMQLPQPKRVIGTKKNPPSETVLLVGGSDEHLG